MTVSPAKMAEQIVMPFGILTPVRPRNHVLHGVQISTQEGTVLKAKRGPAQGMSGGQYTQSDSTGGRTGSLVRCGYRLECTRCGCTLV